MVHLDLKVPLIHGAVLRRCCPGRWKGVAEGAFLRLLPGWANAGCSQACIYPVTATCNYKSSVVATTSSSKQAYRMACSCKFGELA